MEEQKKARAQMVGQRRAGLLRLMQEQERPASQDAIMVPVAFILPSFLLPPMHSRDVERFSASPLR